MTLTCTKTTAARAKARAGTCGERRGVAVVPRVVRSYAASRAGSANICRSASDWLAG